MPAKGVRVERSGVVAVVLAGGDPLVPGVRETWPDDVYVIAADSGVHLAQWIDLPVDLVVGDLDSAHPEAVDAAVAGGARVEQHPRDKDATDLELALEAAQRHGATRVIVAGVAGGRIDHFLGNIALLTAARFSNMQIEAVLEGAHLTILHGGSAPAVIEAEPGTTVTLLPAAGIARGITTTGLQYPLRNEDLPAGTSRGVSNVVAERPASIQLVTGTVLVVVIQEGAS
jgi:thiamine pyrophosphokinase